MARSRLISVALGAAVIALAVLLNPSAERHRDRIKRAVGERSQVDQVLGVGQVTAFLSKYRSLGVASYTTVHDRVVSVGAFGMVVVID